MTQYLWVIQIGGGTMPMPVWSFLEGKDFTDKKILPFCTHEGSGLGKSESDIKKINKWSRSIKRFGNKRFRSK